MPFDFEKPQPLADAVQAISKKTPIGAALSSRQWEEEVPAALKDAAVFSARVTSVQAMQEVKNRLQSLLTMARNAANGSIEMDRSKFIEETQQMANRLGLRMDGREVRGQKSEVRGGEGKVQDFGSERRLKLIYEQLIGAAQGKAFYLQGQDPDVIDAWPALELVRVSKRVVPRNWRERWQQAADAVRWVGVSRSAFGLGQMIALKNSPIWVAISRFGRPYPPFDYNSGMGVQERDREATEALGDILKPGERVSPNADATANDLQASAAGLDPDLIAGMLKSFGEQLVVVGDRVRWRDVTTKGAKDAKGEAELTAAGAGGAAIGSGGDAGSLGADALAGAGDLGNLSGGGL